MDPATDYVPETSQYDNVLDRIRRSLRLADYESAESLMTAAAERKDRHSAEYFNLLGVLYEAQRRWRLARKCYGKAIAADKNYRPAQLNMQRLYELHTFGKSANPAALGDEPDDLLYAKLA